LSVRLRLALIVLAACSRGEPEKVENAALGGDVAARAGSEIVPVELVRKVAIAQKISPREAVDRLVDDAVAADAARRRGLDRSDPGRWNLTAARARIAADRFFADAKAKGPPTDAEVETLTKQHWNEVDRPPSVRTYHVVVCPGTCAAKTKTPESVVHAREVAQALRAVLVDVATTDEIKAKASAFPHPTDVEIHPEELPAIARDGRLVDGGGALDSDFAAGAFAISNVGDTSPIVETKFGFHIIRLLERLPALRMAFEDRRAAFTQETFAMRAAEAKRAHLEAAQKGKDIQISASAERLMRIVTNPAETP
jgi:hypothetical protein